MVYDYDILKIQHNGISDKYEKAYEIKQLQSTPPTTEQYVYNYF